MKEKRMWPCPGGCRAVMGPMTEAQARNGLVIHLSASLRHNSMDVAEARRLVEDHLQGEKGR